MSIFINLSVIFILFIDNHQQHPFMTYHDSLQAYIQDSLRSNWSLPALTDIGGTTLRYCDVARRIAKLHILFKHAELEAGDKIAIVGRNSSQWAVAALASMTYGTVTVPILHDFKSDTIHHLVSHCEAKLLFVDSKIWKELSHDDMPHLKGVVSLDDYSLLYSRNKALTSAREHLNRLFGEQYPERFSAADVEYRVNKPDELALINYTSGSMGFSKGVMLSYGNLWSNIQYCIDGLDFLRPGDGMVAMLPLAHMFGFTVELMHTFVKGCHINFITRTPSPKIILDAFAAVRPMLVITVPLIIEKVVRTRVFPMLEKPAVRAAMLVPFLKKKILAKVKTQLALAFGGNLREIIIGGAALNQDVETFLREIGFPFTIGYGMTECGPLISYCPWDRQRPGSCGRAVDRMEIRVDSPDATTTPGVLWVRGANVMQGYFKNDEATAGVMGDDGWMNTGDIAQVDADGYIYIRGRDKNMILGPSGQNIYPEEIEQRLNNQPYVVESLVIESDGKLKALIVADSEALTRDGKEVDAVMKENIARLNTNLPGFSQISSYRIQPEEFEKTPKRSIKRYLYKE